jgi:hypothetical protein
LGYTLSDGPGLQAFLLVVSEERLPSYNRWRERLGPVAWHSPAAGGEVAWRHDGRQAELLALGPRVRGQVEPVADPPATFCSLCEQIKRIPGVAAVQAVAFPVRPRAGAALPQ